MEDSYYKTYGEPASVPYAANLGWYHNSGDNSNRYTKCDVVTWHGQSSPNFQGPASHTGTLTGHLQPHLTRYFYFRRVRMQGPASRYILGACILDETEGKYFYLHCAYMPQANGENLAT